MQIKNNKTILLSLITSTIIFAGCGANNNSVMIQEADNKKYVEEENKDYISLMNISKEQKENNMFYANYLTNLEKKSKIRLVNREPIMHTSGIPAMYLDVNNFEELLEVLEEVQDTYSIVFDDESYKLLQNKVQNHTIIDMSKRNFTYEELIQKISLRYDIAYKRVDNVYRFYTEETQKYFIPYEFGAYGKSINKNFDGKYSSQEILKTLKSFLPNVEDNSKFVYDKPTGYLYVTAKPSTQLLIKNYISDLDKLNNLVYQFVVHKYEVKSVDGINIDKLNAKIQELDNNRKIRKEVNPNKNDGYYAVIENPNLFKTNVEVRDEVRDYLSNTGASVNYLGTVNLKGQNNKELKMGLTDISSYIGAVSETKESGKKIYTPEVKNIEVGQELFITPRFNENTGDIDLSTSFNYKKLVEMKEQEINGITVESPIVIENTITNNVSVKDGSFLILSSNMKNPDEDRDTFFNRIKNIFKASNFHQIVLIIETKSLSSVGEIK